MLSFTQTLDFFFLTTHLTPLFHITKKHLSPEEFRSFRTSQGLEYLCPNLWISLLNFVYFCSSIWFFLQPLGANFTHNTSTPSILPLLLLLCKFRPELSFCPQQKLSRIKSRRHNTAEIPDVRKRTAMVNLFVSHLKKKSVCVLNE